ncbi:MAG: sigma-70 family RNA polymerase sigma factor [Oscillospiraceae bacterium]|nr:sigma-70 family RNA polymerase sigma factor [Oscillospiraceae bacterium]
MLSIEEVYRAHSQTVYRYLLSLTHDADTSEELTQETFYQAMKSVDRFDGSCKVSTWLCAIAKNALLSDRRKHPASDPLDEVAVLSASPETETLAKLDHVALLRKLHLLPGEMREVLYLRLLGELSFREIGEILSKSENWARVTYYRGKEKLKKELETDGT